MSFSTVFRRFEMRSADSIDHFIQPAFFSDVGAITSLTKSLIATVFQERLPSFNR
jgi:hypothetical protein